MLWERTGTTARNQTWFSAFAGLCDVHFTTVVKGQEPAGAGRVWPQQEARPTMPGRRR